MARSYSDFTAKKLIREHIAACAVGERKGSTKYSWGAGLVLAIGETGNASWIGRVQAPNGKRRDIGLGRYGEVSIEEARAQVAEHKRVAREGRDPKAVKDARRNAERNPLPSFEKAARAVHEERSGKFKNPKHRDQWINSLSDHVFGSLGNLRIDEVDVPAVTKAIKPIWREKPETARRVLQRIAAIIAWSVAHGYRDHELAVRAIRMGLGEQPRAGADERHHSAVPVENAPAVFSALAAKDALSARCLLFCILTAVRSGEARGARWQEIDLDQAKWTVPADRMKLRQAHEVPLSQAAVALLEGIPRIANDAGLIFPSTKGAPLSDVAVTKILRSIPVAVSSNGKPATVHGWRSTFRDWAAERTNVPDGVAEAALAHTVRGKVEAAYRRTKYYEKRIPLMESWAAFLTGAAATVTNLDEARKLKESTG